MVRKFISEFVGTLLLVFFGCGTAVGMYKVISTLYSTQQGITGTEISLFRMAWLGIMIALAFGLILMALVYTIGKVSGCHVNPAISLACLIDGRMSISEFVYYVVAQVLGAILGAAGLTWIFNGTENLGANGFATASLLPKITTMPVAFIIELVLTFVFALVVLSVTKQENKSNGIIIGLTLALVHIFGLPFTGTSVNPARSLGPAIFTKGLALEQLWVFLLAPLVGAALAAIFFKFVIDAEDEEFEEEEPAKKPARKAK